MRGPKRREIGHGLLAERALLPVRARRWRSSPTRCALVSEVLSSNGSTSMASVCGSTLSLMDAGVPIKAPVAGIAMGLVFAEGKYTTLTDILGAEDAFGDMDFKVAGTAEFVTALQLDTKIDGIPADVLAEALEQAKEARLQILEVMADAIAEPRAEVGETAPKIISFEIPIDKIGEVIGPKGKVINAIQQETGADITVDDDGMVGTVTIGSTDGGAVAEAERQIQLILNPPTADVGAGLPGPGRQHHQVRCVRQHPPGPRRPAAHLQDGRRQAHRPGRGRARARRRDRGPGRRRRPQRQGLALARSTPARRRRRRRRRRPAASGRARRAAATGGDAPAGGADAEVVSFEDAFDAELREEFGDLGPAEAAGGGGGDRGGDRGGRGGGRRPRRRAVAAVAAAPSTQR